MQVRTFWARIAIDTDRRSSGRDRRMSSRRLDVQKSAAVLLVVMSLVASPTAVLAYERPGSNERVSVSTQGGPGGGSSSFPAISADGRFVAFWAGDGGLLVPGDTNGCHDVFVRDRIKGTTERVSVASDGSQAISVPVPGCGSVWPSISADGRYVAFMSDAHNLVGVGNDTNLAKDIFVHDRKTGKTIRASVSWNGEETTLEQGSNFPYISRNGRFVSFQSSADNLVENDTNGTTGWTADLFVRDLKTRETTRISVASDGTEANGASSGGCMNPSGRFVAFSSYATNLVDYGDDGPPTVWGHNDVFVHDRKTGKTERISEDEQGDQGGVLPGGGAESWTCYGGSGGQQVFSADGRFVLFDSDIKGLVPNDTNGAFDVFVKDRKTGEVERVSVRSDGVEAAENGSGSASISANGRYVNFTSAAQNLFEGDNFDEWGPDDLATNCLDAIMHAIEDLGSTPHCAPPNGDADIFTYDRLTGATEWDSVAHDGKQLNDGAGYSVPSASGRYVAFAGYAGNVVASGDTNGPLPDDFVRDRGPDLGVGDITGAAAGNSVKLSGWATFAGVALGINNDPGDDGTLNALADGGEITEATFAYRPQLDDFFARIEVKDMPGIRSGIGDVASVGDPKVLYQFKFTAKGVPYEIRVHRAGATIGPTLIEPSFGLFRCSEVVCTEVAPLAGGYGSTGEEVVVALPLQVLRDDGTKISEGDELGSLKAQTTYGSYLGGPTELLDDILLVTDANVTLPEKSVTVTVKGITRRMQLKEGRFSTEFPKSLFGSGPVSVTTKTCLGAKCVTQTFRVKAN